MSYCKKAMLDSSKQTLSHLQNKVVSRHSNMAHAPYWDHEVEAAHILLSSGSTAKDRKSARALYKNKSVANSK